MKCPRCGFLEDKVIDSRVSKEGLTVRRRRECLSCNSRFTTLEEVVPTEIYVIKRDGSREEFNPQKIRDGLEKACYKRQVREEQFDEIMASIHHQLEALGEREVPSEKLGEILMEELAALDAVAYVRFASVYREFKDVDQFVREVRELKKQRKK
jgi:transcriptional repressor NrdR